MWATIRTGLLARKLRLLLTALSVTAGVAFVTGTYVFTDTLGRVLDDVFAEAGTRVDLVVTGRPATGNEDDPAPPLPAGVLQQVRAVDGVAAAAGQVQGTVRVLRGDGQPTTLGPAPAFASNWVDPAFTGSTLRAGRPPGGPSDVAVDAATADRNRLRVGDTLQIAAYGKGTPYAISGIIDTAPGQVFGGATLVLFEEREAQRLLNREGLYDDIGVKAEEGLTHAALRDRLRGQLGDDVRVRTTEEIVRDQASVLREGLGFFNQLLLGFGVIALLVGSFIIVNTFTILIAQRTRELALLRALGASRPQVLGSVLVEAAITGLAGSVVGLMAGVVIAFALRAVVSAFGLGFPSGGLVVAPRTVAVSIGLGTAITLLASVMPAFRASQVPPVAAMRGETGIRQLPLGASIAIRAAMLVVGTAVVVALNRFGMVFVVLGAGLAFVGAVLLFALVAPPLASVLGRAAEAAGIVGRLGRLNAVRNPRRTATTAAALIVGLALVAGAATLAASASRSLAGLVNGAVRADFVVQSTSFEGGMPVELAEAIRSRPGVEQVATLRFQRARLDGDGVSVTGVNRDAKDLLAFRMVEGDIGALDRGELLLDEEAARQRQLGVGEEVVLVFPQGGERRFRLAGTYVSTLLVDGFVAGVDRLEGTVFDVRDSVVLVDVDGRTDRMAPVLKAVADDYPGVQVETRGEFVSSQKRQVLVFLAVIMALLGLTVVIAVLGVVNTLALSVYERVRELGLLRAVGTLRGQVVGAIGVEAVLVSVVGGVLGLVTGVGLGAVVVRLLGSGGLDQFALPHWGVLLAGVVASVGIGILAAVYPSWRAVRLDPLEALATT